MLSLSADKSVFKLLSMNKLISKATIQIQKGPETVFEAIADPEKMNQYFIRKGTGRIEAGADLVWTFPEFDETCPVKVGEVMPGVFISFVWDPETVVEITLKKQTDGSTVVVVTESGKRHDEQGVQWLTGQTEGWANFLACLKAYLEYGINLRRGAFDFMRKEAGL